jgi:hypothetical protein
VFIVSKNLEIAERGIIHLQSYQKQKRIVVRDRRIQLGVTGS